jgi:hypothetical protein
MVLLLCLLLTTPWVTAAVLQITVENNEVELGQPVWLTLRSDQTAVSLNTLDLSAWQDQVVLPRAFDANLGADKHQQTLRLHVYPLHKGQLTLPGLHFLYHTTPPLRINVVAAQDSKRHTPIDFDYQVSTTTPWQQQQVIVACRVTLDNAYAVFKQAAGNPKGVQVLPMRQRAIAQAGTTQYQLGWVLVPARAGKLHVRLPPIQYVRDGVVTHQFYVPPLHLVVQARPAWLPGTIPVGRVQVTDYALARSWLTTSVLSQLRLQLRVDGMAAAVIPDYAQQLHSGADLQYYAAQRKILTTIDHAGIQHDLRYAIPLVAKHIGIYRLPDLRLQYFDPGSGRLTTTHIPGPAVVIVNVWLQGLFLLLLLAGLLWLLRRLLRWWLNYWRRYRAYQTALQLLPQSQSVSAIRRVMQIMAQAEGESANFSYWQWQSRMAVLTSLAQHVPVTALNAACYGRAELEFAPLLQVLTRICRQRRLAVW